MAASDLCDVESVRRAMRLQPGDTRDDARIQQGIEHVTARILRHLGRRYLLNEDQEEVTEYHDGQRATELALAEWPVISVTSVHDSLDRTYGAADELDEGDDFLVESSESGACLRRLPAGESVSVLRGFETGIFQDGVRNVRVVYVPGYASRATLPMDLVAAAVFETAAWMTRAPGAGLTRTQAGDLSEDYDLAAFRPETMRTLARHRRLL